jgi:hypothetical protein
VHISFLTTLISVNVSLQVQRQQVCWYGHLCVHLWHFQQGSLPSLQQVMYVFLQLLAARVLRIVDLNLSCNWCPCPTFVCYSFPTGSPRSLRFRASECDALLSRFCLTHMRRWPLLQYMIIALCCVFKPSPLALIGHGLIVATPWMSDSQIQVLRVST